MSSLHSTNTHGNTTTGYNKDSTVNTTSSQYPKVAATTGAGDTYKTDDNLVKTGNYASGLENNAPYNSGMTGTGYSGTGTGHHVGSGHHVGTGTGALAGGAVGAAAGHPIAGAAVGAAAGHHNKHGAHGTHGMTHGTTHEMNGNLPAGSAVPVIGGQQNVITGVNNVPTAGPQYQNTLPNAANRDGLVVNDGLGGPLGGAVVLGGQCECLANGGSCSHGAGNCVCRGCTSKATTVNPGINVGVSTAQYTAPASTSGLGGGVGEHTGIAGLVHPNPNVPVAQQTTHTTTTTMHPATNTSTTGMNTGMHTAGRNVDGDGHHATHFGQGVSNSQLTQSSNRAPESVIAGSEYASGNVDPAHVHRGAAPASSNHSIVPPRSNAASPGPITDNSNPDVYLSEAAGTGTNTYTR